MHINSIQNNYQSYQSNFRGYLSKRFLESRKSAVVESSLSSLSQNIRKNKKIVKLITEDAIKADSKSIKALKEIMAEYIDDLCLDITDVYVPSCDFYEKTKIYDNVLVLHNKNHDILSCYTTEWGDSKQRYDHINYDNDIRIAFFNRYGERLTSDSTCEDIIRWINDNAKSSWRS